MATDASVARGRVLRARATIGLSIFALVVAAFVVSAPAFAATAIVVDDPSDAPDADLSDGTCDAVGADSCTLRAAVQTANATSGDDVITLPAGTYNLDLAGEDDFAAVGDLDVTGYLEGLTINGAGAATTIIDASALGDRVFALVDQDVTFHVDGVTIRNGTPHDGRGGGGIYMSADGQTLQLDNSVLTGNVAASATEDCILDADYGNYRQCHTPDVAGAIQSDGQYSALDLNNSKVTDNTAVGTVTCYDYADETRTDSCREVMNVTGSAINVAGIATTLDLMASEVTDNKSLRTSCPTGYTCEENYPGQGGAVGSLADDFVLTVDDSLVSGNDASGFYYYGSRGSVALQNGTDVTDHLTGNGLSWTSLGIPAPSESPPPPPPTTVSITDSNVSGNYAYYWGGGVSTQTTGLVEISRSTIMDNHASPFGGSGGGLYHCCVGLDITESTISGNEAGSRGGGIENAQGVMTLTSSTVDNNKAGSSGGIHTSDELHMTDSSVSGNEVTGGGEAGGIGTSSTFNGAMTITRSEIDGNSAEQIGGIVAYGGTWTITGSSISNNSSVSYDGGGVWSGYYGQEGADITIRNSTVAYNTTGANGGGLAGRNYVLENVTIAHNSATDGGGIYDPGTVMVDPNDPDQLIYEVSTSAEDSIIAENTATSTDDDNCGGLDPVPTGKNLDDDGSCGFTTVTDAGVADLLAYNGGPTKNLALESGSPAIDAAEACPPPTEDQRGFQRPEETGEACDIGAFEVQTDSDNDAVPDYLDECPGDAGPASNAGCPGVVTPPPDSDNDGVIDADDACPTQSGPANNNGCPVVVPPPDGDGDGVPDANDQCPTVSGPANNNGCPVVVPPPDGDGDGVIDADDSCPTVGGPANNSGCPVPNVPGPSSSPSATATPTASPSPTPTDEPLPDLPQCETDPTAICGTDGDDNIVIDANSDPDGDGVVEVYLGAGDDTVCLQIGSGLSVIIHGQGGDDTVVVGDCGSRATSQSSGSVSGAAAPGSLDFSGGRGNDTFHGGADGETFRGGLGDDKATGGGGNDILRGGPNNDSIHGAAGADLVAGGLNDDELRGGAGRDTIKGGPGTDTLSGGPGTDTLDGGANQDTCPGADDKLLRCE